MPLSAFSEKAHRPTDEELARVLGKAHAVWLALISAVAEQVGPITEAWGFSSASTGWGLRLRRKERIIVYMTPQDERFLVSFALGEKAVAAAHQSGLPEPVLKAIDEAPRYAEGRGVRFEVSDSQHVSALARLARIKHER